MLINLFHLFFKSFAVTRSGISVDARIWTRATLVGSESSVVTQVACAPLASLHYISVFSSRYRMPVISRVVSPSKPSVPAMPSHAPEANPVNFNSKATSKPISSVAIHSRCCCRHHKQGDDQKATLKSRSSDSLTKEVLIFSLVYFFFILFSMAVQSYSCKTGQKF